MKSDKDIIKQFKKHKSITARGLSKQYQNIRDNQAFYAGDIMNYNDYIQFQDQNGNKRRAMVQFNLVKPYVDAVKGFMAQNRRAAKYVARMMNQTAMQAYSAYTNAMADYVNDNANADQVKTQQDGDLLICGISAVETAMTYGEGFATTDPNGEIIMDALDIEKVGWDPYARASNVLDSRWVFYPKEYDIEEAVTLFQDADKDDFELSGDDEDNGGDYQWYARGGRYNKIKEDDVDWVGEKGQMAKVYFYQWFEYEEFYRAENPAMAMRTPKAQQMAMELLQQIAEEMQDEADDDLFEFNPQAEILTFNDKYQKKLKEHFGKHIEIFTYTRKVYYTAVMSGSHVFTSYRNVSQQGFTVKFKTGGYDAKNKLWVGMVTSMRQPVLYKNKALTELMFIIGANSKGGVMVETNAVDDIQKFQSQYAKTDAVIEVNDGALAAGKIKAKREPFAPTGYEGIIQMAGEGLNDAVGFDKNFLGNTQNANETGILFKRRIRQVISLLAIYFDNATLFEKEQARLMLDYLRVYAQNNDGGLFKLIGPEGKTQYLQISADRFAASYDVSIQEAPDTPEEKQEQAAILSGIGDKIIQFNQGAAMSCYGMAVKYLPLAEADKLQLMQSLQPPQQKPIDPQYVAQLENQVKSLMSQVTQADVQEKQTKAVLNLASARQKDSVSKSDDSSAFKDRQEGVGKALENHFHARVMAQV